MNKRQGMAIVWISFIAFAACGGGEKVGEQFEEFEGGKAGERIGEFQETPTPKPKQDAGPAAAPTGPAATKEPEKKSQLTVQITSAGFDPTRAGPIFTNSTVTVVNVDSAAHTYTSSDGTYDTGQIAPGQSVNFIVDTAGSFQMEDRTRNWIQGTLEVVAR